MHKGWSGLVGAGPLALGRAGSRVLRTSPQRCPAAAIGLFALLLSHQAHGQEVWRHIDDQGQTRYADRPFPGAVRMDPPSAAQWLGGRAREASGRPAAQSETRDSAAAPAKAPSPALEIVFPATGETVWGAGGELEIRLTIDGDTEDDARLSILLDGAEASWRGEPPTLRLAEVWRGEHSLQARLLDRDGKPLAASEEIRFFKREPAAPPR